MSLRCLTFLAGLALAFGLCLPAPAQELFTVSGVHVDATAASSGEALNVAVAQGRAKAWTTLYRRLTRQQDWGRQPALDGATLLRLARGYTIANERRSTTRYVADVTYMFNPDGVARVLQGAGIAFTQSAPRRILVVAMAPGFTAGPWAQALSAPAFKDSLVPFAVAGAGDASNLQTLNFDTAGWGDVAQAAGRIRANEAALVEVAPAAGKLTVTVKRLGINEAPNKMSVDVPGAANAVAYPAAAEAAVRLIEDMWKSRAAVDFSQRGKLTVVARPANAAEWGALRSSLSGIDNVTGVQVLAMDIGYAQISISYQGGVEQLRDALGGAGLSLSQKSGEWTLAMAPSQ
jgi:hypothetical protein